MQMVIYVLFFFLILTGFTFPLRIENLGSYKIIHSKTGKYLIPSNETGEMDTIILPLRYKSKSDNGEVEEFSEFILLIRMGDKYIWAYKWKELSTPIWKEHESIELK